MGILWDSIELRRRQESGSADDRADTGSRSRRARAQRAGERSDEQRSSLEAEIADDVQRAAGRYLDPNYMPISVAGDAGFIGARLQWSASSSNSAEGIH